MSDGICESTLTPNDVTYRCTKVAGHEGMHSGYVFEWHEERPKPSPAPEGAEMETLRELARGAARELHRIAARYALDRLHEMARLREENAEMIRLAAEAIGTDESLRSIGCVRAALDYLQQLREDIATLTRERDEANAKAGSWCGDFLRVSNKHNEARRELEAKTALLREVREPFARMTEWICKNCAYHNRGPVCTHCRRLRTGTEARYGAVLTVDAAEALLARIDAALSEQEESR